MFSHDFKRNHIVSFSQNMYSIHALVGLSKGQMFNSVYKKSAVVIVGSFYCFDISVRTFMSDKITAFFQWKIISVIFCFDKRQNP